MSDRFDLVFRGRTVSGVDLDVAKRNLAKMLKAKHVAAVEPLFSGERKSLKKGLDKPTAEKYQSALRRAGLVTAVVRQRPEPPAGQPSQRASFAIDDGAQQQTAPGRATFTVDQDPEPTAPTTTSTHAATSGEEPSTKAPAPPAENDDLLPAGTAFEAPEPIAEPAIDISALHMDEPGATLVEARSVAEPVINTDALSLADVGEVFDEAPAITTPEFGFEGLDIDAPGVQIVDAQPVAAPDIDVSTLSMEAPGSIIDQPDNKPAPRIDISKLSLDDGN